MSVEVTDSLQSPSATAPLTLRGANSCRNYCVEFDGLVEGVFKLLLRLAVGGPVAVLHGGLAVLHGLGGIVQRLLEFGATVGRRAGIRLAVRGAGLATIGIGTRLVPDMPRRSPRWHRHVLGIARGRAGIATEHLIQGLIQRIRESDLITECDQRLLEQREWRSHPKT